MRDVPAGRRPPPPRHGIYGKPWLLRWGVPKVTSMPGAAAAYSKSCGAEMADRVMRVLMVPAGRGRPSCRPDRRRSGRGRGRSRVWQPDVGGGADCSGYCRYCRSAGYRPPRPLLPWPCEQRSVSRPRRGARRGAQGRHTRRLGATRCPQPATPDATFTVEPVLTWWLWRLRSQACTACYDEPQRHQAPHGCLGAYHWSPWTMSSTNGSMT